MALSSVNGKTLLEVQVHPIQKQILDDPNDWIFCIAGKQSGKSTVGALKFIDIILLNQKNGIHGNYLICSPTYRLLKNGTIPTFLKYWNNKDGIYKRADSRIELNDGNYIFIVSAENPDAIESWNILAAWLDEAGQYKKEVWEKVNQRLSQEVAKIIISTTPYGLPTSWLNTELIERRQSIPWMSYYNWSSLDNPFINKENYERLRAITNAQIWKRDFEGLFTKVEGLIYPDFDRELDVVAPFDIKDLTFIAGMDYGFTDPTVILIIAKKDDTFYIVDEFYKSESRLDEQANFLKKYKGTLKQILYDPSAVGWCTELQRYCHMNLQEAENEVEAGIGRIYKLQKEHRLKVFSTCENTIRELESYVYADGKNKPEHANSHSPDALRYAFSRDLFGIYPELRRPKPEDVLKQHTNEKGEYIPPKPDYLELEKDKRKIVKHQAYKPKEPEDAWDYKPIGELWTKDD